MGADHGVVIVRHEAILAIWPDQDTDGAKILLWGQNYNVWESPSAILDLIDEAEHGYDEAEHGAHRKAVQLANQKTRP